MEVCSPRRATQADTLPGAVLVKEAFRGYTEFAVPLWTDWGAVQVLGLRELSRLKL